VRGTILQVNVSGGGLPKRAIPSGVLTELGIEGDGHAHPAIHGGPQQAVLVIAAEVVDELIGRGYPLFYGALGENLTIRGIPIRDLRIGDRLLAGAARLEIAKPRGPCSALDVYGESLKREIYDLHVMNCDPSSPRWGMSGLYARVLAPGPVAPGDIIVVEPKLA
jgi:MOSC domain-containing protein YiiM